MQRTRLVLTLAVVVLGFAASDGRAGAAAQAPPPPPAPGQGRLIVYGDMALFQPPGHPENCILRNRFKRGEPVGWRMFVADPSTGKREESAQLVVHVNASGKTIDIPMRYRATAAQPEREFWVAKWVVPQDTPVGIIRYTVTATDKQFLIVAPDGVRYCTAPGRATAPYDKRRNARERTVWVAPLQVGDLQTGAVTTISKGLVWVIGADWR